MTSWAGSSFRWRRTATALVPAELYDVVVDVVEEPTVEDLDI
ncbi:hypothetical protein ACIBF5_27380 [Micromonospora sp. NPDC050417]